MVVLVSRTSFDGVNLYSSIATVEISPNDCCITYFGLIAYIYQYLTFTNDLDLWLQQLWHTICPHLPQCAFQIVDLNYI